MMNLISTLDDAYKILKERLENKDHITGNTKAQAGSKSVLTKSFNKPYILIDCQGQVFSIRRKNGFFSNVLLTVYPNNSISVTRVSSGSLVHSAKSGEYDIKISHSNVIIIDLVNKKTKVNKRIVISRINPVSIII